MAYQVCNAYDLTGAVGFSAIYSIPEKTIYCSGTDQRFLYEKIMSDLGKEEENYDIDLNTLQQIAVKKCIEVIKMRIERFFPIKCFVFRRYFYDGTNVEMFHMDETLTRIYPLKYDSLESAFLNITGNPHFKDSSIDANIIEFITITPAEPDINRCITNNSACAPLFIKAIIVLMLIFTCIIILWSFDVINKIAMIVFGAILCVVSFAGIIYCIIGEKHRKSLHPAAPFYLL